MPFTNLSTSSFVSSFQAAAGGEGCGVAAPGGSVMEQGEGMEEAGEAEHVGDQAGEGNNGLK